MKNWLIRIALLSLLVAGLAYYYLFFGTSGQGGMTCVFNKTLGWQCPGCGGQRALNALLHGNFKEAFVFNPLIYVFLPLIACLAVIVVEGYLIGNVAVVKRLSFPTNFGYWFLGVIIVFTLLRNLFAF